jgi:hypothetical protein
VKMETIDRVTGGGMGKRARRLTREAARLWRKSLLPLRCNGNIEGQVVQREIAAASVNALASKMRI